MESEIQVEGEVHVGINRLVAEIDRAVGLIERLREENAGLKQECQAHKEEVERLETALLEAQAERDRLQSVYDENASLIENKGEIQRKIETMLSRLDTLHASAAAMETEDTE